MRRRLWSLFVAALVVLVFGAAGAYQEPPEYGPANGALVIVGGGGMDGTGIVEKFIQLAGGPEKKYIIVPTAGGNKSQDGTVRVYKEEQIIATWLKRGLKNVKMLHTNDAKLADTEDFVKDLKDADAVWFNGGRQWHIVDSYMNTRTVKEFHKVLERGGVIGGSSAGATIQGEYLVRGAIAGPEVMMTPEPEHEKGFAFLRKSAIDQHINARNRWDDLIPVIQKFPNLLGIGLSEGTAIIVTGDKVRSHGQVEGRDPRQRARLSAVGKTVLRAVGGGRLQHEDAEDREVRNRRDAKARRPGRPIRRFHAPFVSRDLGCRARDAVGAA
jgi:cyanophycinase